MSSPRDRDVQYQPGPITLVEEGWAFGRRRGHLVKARRVVERDYSAVSAPYSPPGHEQDVFSSRTLIAERVIVDPLLDEEMTQREWHALVNS